MSDQPVAASDRARGQSPAGSPAIASTSAAATTRGRWLIAATAASCSSAPRRTGRAPVARASASTRSRSFDLASARRDDDPRPVDEEVGGRRSGARRLAPGHRVPADEGQPGRGRGLDDPALRAADVGDRRAGIRDGSERGGLVGERRNDRERRPGQDDEPGALDRGRRVRRRLVEEPAPHALGGSEPRGRPRHEPGFATAGRPNGRGDRAADQPEPDERDPRGQACGGIAARHRPLGVPGPLRRRQAVCPRHGGEGPARRSATRRSMPPGGPGSCCGFFRRSPLRRFSPRRSPSSIAPQRGQRRSSGSSSSRGAVV